MTWEFYLANFEATGTGLAQSDQFFSSLASIAGQGESLNETCPSAS
jgi:hypothetical protein